jgi:uncharacterized protein YbaR (Trm112 family)
MPGPVLPPVRLVCPECRGSDLVVYGSTSWDEKTQTWGGFDPDDGAEDYCIYCEDSVRGEFVPVSDLKSAARQAIAQEGAA